MKRRGLEEVESPTLDVLLYLRLSRWIEAPPPGCLQWGLVFASVWGCCRPLRSACASVCGRLRRKKNARLEAWVQGNLVASGNGVSIPMRFPVLSLRGAPPPPRPHGWLLFSSASSLASRHSASFLSRSRRSCCSWICTSKLGRKLKCWNSYRQNPMHHYKVKNPKNFTKFKWTQREFHPM